MTFMRKFMDLLNMDNWERYKEKGQDEEKQSSGTIADENTEQNENNYEMSPINGDFAINADPVISETESMEKNPNTEKTPLTAEPSTSAACETVNNTEFIKSSSNDTQVTIPDDLLHLNESILPEQIDQSFNVPVEKKIIIPFTKENYSFDPNYIDYSLFTKFWSIIPYIDDNRKSIPEASSDEKIFYCLIIMLYNMSDCAPCSVEDFDRDYYYYCDCNVSNAHLVFEHLFNNGYFTQPTIEHVLNTYRIPELKTILRSLGCKVSGNKPDLIRQLMSALSPDDINSMIQSCDYLVVSDKGLHLLHDNFDYVELHRHYNYHISLYEFNQWRICGNKVRTFTDTCFRVLTERVRQNLSQFYYLGISFDYRSLCDIELSFSHPDIAVQDFIRYIYFLTCDIHSIQWYGNKDHLCYECSESEMLEYKTFFPDSLALTFSKIQNYYSPQLASSIYCTPDYPPSLLTLNEFIEFFEDLRSQVIFDKKKYNKIIASREYRLWYFNK